MRNLLVATCLLGAGAMSSAHAVEAFIGRWAATPQACFGGGSTAATAPLVATDSSLSWIDGTCRIGKMYKAGKAVYLQVHCDARGDVPVTLEAAGNRMRVSWNRARIEEMQRCK